jgi:hypothetical protein
MRIHRCCCSRLIGEKVNAFRMFDHWSLACLFAILFAMTLSGCTNGMVFDNETRDFDLQTTNTIRTDNFDDPRRRVSRARIP